MVLRGRERQDTVAVRDDDEARFFAIQVVLNDDTGTGVAEAAARQHVCRRALRLVQIHGDDHPFSGRQAVGFDDDRRALLANVFERRFEFRKVLIGGCRNVMAPQEVLGERFRALQLRRRCRRAKTR